MYCISDVHINHLIRPVGIGKEINIRWVLNSNYNNVHQCRYHIQISKTIDFTECVYDSGIVESSESAHVHIVIEQLESLCRYYVRCRSYNQNNEDSSWSETTYFVTGILYKNEWKGHFISAETENEAQQSKGTVLINKFQCQKKKIQSAYMVSTALGLYDIKINNHRIGNDELKPGWTSYHNRVLYQTYDVKEYLTSGLNQIKAMVGVGWYKGLMGFLLERNNYGTQTAFYCMLHIIYEDGLSQFVFTDKSWKGFDAPVVFADIYNGEHYDARLEIDYLTEKQINSNCKTVYMIPYPFSNMVAQSGCTVKQMESLKPKNTFITPKGETVIDFGQNIAGWISFKGCGPEGESITIKHFEVLDGDGNVYLNNLRTAKQEYKVTFRGNDICTYEPHFTYMGFRYIQVITSSNKCSTFQFIAHALYSEMEDCGQFECSNKLVNQLHNNIKWSMKGNFVDIPTDCPQRDERCGWTGDAQIFCKTSSYLMNVNMFFQKWLDDMVLDQTKEGGVPHIVPDILTNARNNENWLVKNGTHSASAWADAIIIIPWMIFQMYGDQSILEKYYPAMKSWIDFMTKYSNNGIFDYGVQLGDWLALDAEEGSYYGATPNDYVCSVYYIYSCRLFALIAEIVGNKIDAIHYSNIYKKLIQFFKKHYIKKDGMLTVNTQTAYILALHFHIIPENQRENYTNYLVKLLKENDSKMVTGFVGTPYFCTVLSDNGHVKEAYDLLLREEYPSWLYEVKQGATTIWEHWDGIKPDGSMWSDEMNSFNHYAYGAIGAWLYEECAGIQPDMLRPGFKHWIIHPRVYSFQYVNASYKSTYGLGRVKWIRDRDIQLWVEIPVNTTATIILDDCSYIYECNDIKFNKYKKGYKAQILSGKYFIRYVK